LLQGLQTGVFKKEVKQQHGGSPHFSRVLLKGMKALLVAAGACALWGHYTLHWLEQQQVQEVQFGLMPKVLLPRKWWPLCSPGGFKESCCRPVPIAWDCACNLCAENVCSHSAKHGMTFHVPKYGKARR